MQNKVSKNNNGLKSKLRVIGDRKLKLREMEEAENLPSYCAIYAPPEFYGLVKVFKAEREEKTENDKDEEEYVAVRKIFGSKSVKFAFLRKSMLLPEYYFLGHVFSIYDAQGKLKSEVTVKELYRHNGVTKEMFEVVLETPGSRKRKTGREFDAIEIK
jgi:hypothetical protein